MYNILNNYKRWILILIKWAIVVIAFYYLYQKLLHNDQLSFSQFKLESNVLFSNGLLSVFLVLLFTDLNWFLEIIKWRKLVAYVQKIGFYEAYKQSLSALTVSLITPNKIGEYGAKALYYKSEDRKDILFLTFLGNACQLTVTVFFGLIGLLFLVQNFEGQLPVFKPFNVFLGIVFVLILLFLGSALLLKNMKYLATIIPKNTILTILNLSFLRYLVFAHQFVFLLYLFHIETSYWVVLNLLFCMYLLSSIIPSMAIFDWVIKGSIAVFLFGLIGVNELTILTITTIMWLLNSALPALIGSVFVLNFKPVYS